MAYRVSVAVLCAAGTNCDRETAHAFAREGDDVTVTRLNMRALSHDPSQLARHAILAIPGGFSYGDDIASGKLFANELRLGAGDALAEFVEAGRLVLGICNGFQVLVKAGLLPGRREAQGRGQPAESAATQPLTLTHNDSQRYEDRWVQLAKNPACASVFLRGIERLELPVAHAEGKLVARDPDMLGDWVQAGIVALTYVAPDGAPQDGAPQDGPARYPHNPNGSLGDVAALADASGRVLGLMPHPERHIEFFHHPEWTRRDTREPGDGARLFANAVAYARTEQLAG